MNLTRLSLMASVLLSMQGCLGLPERTVLLDRRIPHQLAEDCDVPVLARQPDGTYVTEIQHALKGDWIAAQELIKR
jgi:hypothetical protein